MKDHEAVCDLWSFRPWELLHIVSLLYFFLMCSDRLSGWRLPCVSIGSCRAVPLCLKLSETTCFFLYIVHVLHPFNTLNLPDLLIPLDLPIPFNVLTPFNILIPLNVPIPLTVLISVNVFILLDVRTPLDVPIPQAGQFSLSVLNPLRVLIPPDVPLPHHTSDYLRVSNSFWYVTQGHVHVSAMMNVS